MAKNKGGRPTIEFDHSKLDELEECAYMGMSAENIADYFGFNRDTFYELLKRDKNVNRRYKKGKARGIRSTGSKLKELIDAGNPSAIFFYLKTQAKWRETDNLNVSNEDGSMISNEKIYVEFIKNKKKNKGDNENE